MTATKHKGKRLPEAVSGRIKSVALSEYRGRHAGETIIVCGCGASLSEFQPPPGIATIGVNDIGRKFDPDYLVVLNSRRQFKGDRFRYVERSRAQTVFTQLDLGIRHPHVVKFKLGQRGGTNFSNPSVLHYTRNSPYLALCLAIHLGAEKIGLIGVDFTDHHFFAKTGRHPLTTQLETIDKEFGKLVESCRTMGVEVFNLGSQSRLTSIRKQSLKQFASRASFSLSATTRAARPLRVFVVHYQFLSCGDVITQGLADAARELGVEHETAGCDDTRLPDKVKEFAPDLLFVIHGRKFRQLWGNRFASYRSAVWLVDEPYEVDDTVNTSRLFDTVFVNDTSTISRHINAHYLPLAYNPSVHRPVAGPKMHDVGFIGGHNDRRERLLLALADAGLLSYLVGGPWKSVTLRALCLSGNTPPHETTRLYQHTRIIINIFREQHHFNRLKVPPYSLNPRIYEALGCGALVVSEKRTELNDVFPTLPQFETANELVSVVSSLLREERCGANLLNTATRILSAHNYRKRLGTVLDTCFPGRTMSARNRHKKTEHNAVTHRYDILMVVHNGLEMIKLAVLRTLQLSDRNKARLCIVDNASSDGSEVWLGILERRGDIDLIRETSNIGHGPGLERARQATHAPVVVTLDSDAFPLTNDWLSRLEDLLQDDVKVTGIGHHRGYIHPSCLMIARRTLDDYELTFLNEKDKSSRFDVAERISAEIARHGFRIAALARTGEQRRGSRSEPVYLGSKYGEILYHQWYSTRAILAGGKEVDDVPQAAIEQSLHELFAARKLEPSEITIVMGLRANLQEPERERNAMACLSALNCQSIERWRYRIIVVEQDSQTRCSKRLAPFVDDWIFARNPGPYNRGWGFNIGACQTCAQSGILCLIDADVLVPKNFLERALNSLLPKVKAVQPYDEFLYLDHESTLNAIDHLADPGEHRYLLEQYAGRSFRNSSGGCVLVDAVLYRELGGHNEDFRGWGREDREFIERLDVGTRIVQIPQTLLHLDHPPAAMDDHWAKANRALIDQLRRGKTTDDAQIGQLDRYAEENSMQEGEVRNNAAIYRNWENWHRWPSARLDQVVLREKSLRTAESDRYLLANLVRAFGDEVLDLGCGPGALRIRLATQHPNAYCVGVDVTHDMLLTAQHHFTNAALCRADAGRLPFVNDCFDVVVMRHLLEHLPGPTMQAVLHEAIRVSRKAVVIAFYVAPSNELPRNTCTVGENFLETRWAPNDLLEPIENLGWHLAHSYESDQIVGESEAIWIITPQTMGKRDTVDRVQGLGIEPSLQVSIVMPTYQRADTLRSAVEMVLAQSHHNWELIIVDNYGDVSKIPKDARIHLYRHSEKASSSYARNMGIQYARGDLICFFDDDDDMYPDYLAHFVEVFDKHPKTKMVRCGMFVSENRINFSYATPECCVRRNYATPSWDNRGPSQDQRYFQGIVRRNRWSESRGDIVVVRKALCRANMHAVGGLRSGGY